MSTPVVIGAYRLDLPGHVVTGPAGRALLTPLEARFLRHLLARRGEAVSTAELLREVWGYHPSVRTRAVPLLVSRLRARLGDGEGALVQTVPGGAYRLGPAVDPSLPARAEALTRRLGGDPAAHAALAALLPDVAAALAGDALSPADRARLLVAEAAWATSHLVQRSALPLWQLAEVLPAVEAATCALWAARLGLLSGAADTTEAALAPWLERCPDDLAGRVVRGEILITLANLDTRAGAHARGRERATAALALADRLGDPRLRGVALGTLAKLQGGARGGQDELAAAGFRDAVATLRAAGEHVLAAEQECSFGVLLYGQGALDHASAVLGRAADTLGAAGRTLDVALCRVNHGTVRLAAGDPTAAFAIAEEAARAFVDAVDHAGEVHARLLAGRALAALGRVPEAEASLSRARELAQRLGLRRHREHATRYLAWCAAAAGDEARARELVATTGFGEDERVAALYARLWSGEATAAELAELGERLGAPPDDPRPGPRWVDATLTARLRPPG